MTLPRQLSIYTIKFKIPNSKEILHYYIIHCLKSVWNWNKSTARLYTFLPFFNLKIKKTFTKTYLLLFYFLFIHIPMIKSVLALFDYLLNFWRLYIVCYFEMENNSFSKHEDNKKHGLHGLTANQTFLASVPSTCM